MAITDRSLGTDSPAAAALLSIRIRPLFWSLVVAFNLVGTIDIITDYYHGIQFGLASLAGELGAAYVIPILFVPVLMITHVAAFCLLAHAQSRATGALAGTAT